MTYSEFVFCEKSFYQNILDDSFRSSRPSYCKADGKPAVARYILNDLRYFFSIATLAHSRVAEDVMEGCFYDAGSCFDDDQKKAWTLYYQHRSKRQKPAVDIKGTEALTDWLRLDKLYSCGYPMGKEVEGFASYLSSVADFPFKVWSKHCR